ncbi:antirestriction protein ArdA [Kineococcus esterisolvens]|uniref:antirestriction protein ArdA n=1 Tax=unclassified Kineococcus TaxID=2621656 RepID=UPI003D7CF25D
MSEPRVWIGCLACYNEGRLVGQWYAAEGAASVTIQDVHSTFPRPLPAEHEELWCMDGDDFDGLMEGECSPAHAQKMAEAHRYLAEERRLDVRLVVQYAQHVGLSLLDDDLADQFEEHWRGEHDSLTGYAEDFLEDTGLLAQVPEGLRYYIDFEKYARDMELGGDVWTIEAGGAVHVFTN